jgi:hypothetical protein
MQAATTTRLRARSGLRSSVIRRDNDHDPMSDVIKLGHHHHTFAAIMAVLVALFVHGTAAARVAMIDVELLAWTRTVRLEINDRLATTYDIELEKPKPVEPAAPEPPKEEPKDQPKPPPAPPPRANEPPPPPPAAAQAGRVLMQEPDPNTPVDFTNTFVVGNGDSYAGGVTLAAGTSTKAVYDRSAQAGGVIGGHGTAPSKGALVDRSRTLSVRNSNWHCDFPSEADSEQIDQMVVPTEVTVGADGRVTNARATKDPGFGFARAAVQCALRQGAATFDLALDIDGHPIPGTRVFNVHFER